MNYERRRYVQLQNYFLKRGLNTFVSIYSVPVIIFASLLVSTADVLLSFFCVVPRTTTRLRVGMLIICRWDLFILFDADIWRVIRRRKKICAVRCVCYKAVWIFLYLPDLNLYLNRMEFVVIYMYHIWKSMTPKFGFKNFLLITFSVDTI